MTDRTPLTRAARALGDVFTAHGFTSDAIAVHLGPHATDALYRGEPAAVRRRLGDATALSRLISFFILRDPLPRAQTEALLGPEILADLAAAETITTGSTVQMLIDVRPHVIAGTDRWIFSDADASMTIHVPGPDHVLGVGAASLSLLQATPTTPVDSVLDLGTGSGVLALAQASSSHVTATDVHPRALDFAEASLAAGSALEGVELLEGSWFEPVAGRRFDRIVANPPFVVGLGDVDHVYRDSGLNLDGASELVASQAAAHLTPDGSAYLLAAWAHTADGSWQQRVASWLPDHGVEAWVLQRDVADPELYVGTWLRDESIDPRSPEGAEKTTRWLDHFAREQVTGIGFGFIALRRIDDDASSEVTAEDISQPFTDPLGPEIEEYFARSAWLRGKTAEQIAASRFQVRPTVAREDVFVPDAEVGAGFVPAVSRLTRTDGPRFSHEIDELLATLLAGLNPAGLPLEDTAELLAYTRGVDVDKLISAAVPAIVDLVRHGLVLPAELIAKEN